MTTITDPDSQCVIDALIALASRDGLGEDIAWKDVEVAIASLIDGTVSKSDLRRRINELNDHEVALTLAEWFDRAADAREDDAADANRPAEKILAPIRPSPWVVQSQAPSSRLQ